MSVYTQLTQEQRLDFPRFHRQLIASRGFCPLQPLNRLPVPERLPRWRNDVGHCTALNQPCRRKRNLAIASVDSVHGSVAGVLSPITVRKHIGLRVHLPGIGGRHLHLMHTLPVPWLILTLTWRGLTIIPTTFYVGAEKSEHG